jgi:hypothetical protein
MAETNAQEREDAVKSVLGELNKLGCPCTVNDCPFHGNCYLCVRNHRADGTLACCQLPDIPERNQTDDYPLCRSPDLWLMAEKKR